MNIDYIKCNHCENYVFSFNTHDYKQCKCGKVAIDGGFEYTRLIGNQEDRVLFNVPIREAIEHIREQFIWGRNYDENMKPLAKTERILLKDLKTDHIINILIYFTNKDAKSIAAVVNKGWLAIHTIFLEELAYRERNKKKFTGHIPTATHL